MLMSRAFIFLFFEGGNVKRSVPHRDFDHKHITAEINASARKLLS